MIYLSKLKISKEDYCNSVKQIQLYDKEICEFSKCMQKFSDTYYLSTIGSNLCYNLIDLLSKLTNDYCEATSNDTLLSWWLYEDVEKKLYKEDGSFIDVTKIEDLYDYLESRDI